jgi:hypothetical protein
MSTEQDGASEHIGRGITSAILFGIGGFLIGVVWANAIGFDWRLGGGILGGLCALGFGFLGFAMNKDGAKGMAFMMPGVGVVLLIIGLLVWGARALIFHW